MIPCKPLRTWPPAPKDCFSEVVPKCPMAHLIPNFPCPGPQRHRLHYYEDHPTAPSGKGEAICRVGAFSNLRFTKCPQYPAGNLKLLEDTLMSISYENVDGVVQLGGVLDTTNVETKGEVDDIIAHLAHSFNKTYSKLWHVIGDMESAVRDQYTASFMADLPLSLEKTQSCVRCCGNLYYTVPIGPQWRLIVLDGYELLATEPRNTCDIPTIENSETTGDGFIMHCSIRNPIGRECAMHECGSAKRVGWPQELMANSDFVTACERGQMPRVRLAVSRVQLQWLDTVLQDALHCNENVLVACHAPLHPLLVRDRSTLIMNWREVLKLLMQYGVVRCCLTGRPASCGAEPPENMAPYRRDHGILYYSLPPVGETAEVVNRVSAHLILDLGFDFVRVRGESIGLSQADQEFGLFHPFRPKTQVSAKDRDYTFNAAVDRVML